MMCKTLSNGSALPPSPEFASDHERNVYFREVWFNLKSNDYLERFQALRDLGNVLPKQPMYNQKFLETLNARVTCMEYSMAETMDTVIRFVSVLVNADELSGRGVHLIDNLEKLTLLALYYSTISEGLDREEQLEKVKEQKLDLTTEVKTLTANLKSANEEGLYKLNCYKLTMKNQNDALSKRVKQLEKQLEEAQKPEIKRSAEGTRTYESMKEVVFGRENRLVKELVVARQNLDQAKAKAQQEKIRCESAREELEKLKAVIAHKTYESPDYERNMLEMDELWRQKIRKQIEQINWLKEQEEKDAENRVSLKDTEDDESDSVESSSEDDDKEEVKDGRQDQEL